MFQVLLPTLLLHLHRPSPRACIYLPLAHGCACAPLLVADACRPLHARLSASCSLTSVAPLSLSRSFQPTSAMAQRAAKAAKRKQTSDAASASESESSLASAAPSGASDEEEQEDAAAASPSSTSSVAREWSTALRRTIAIAARLRTELATARSLAAEGEAVRERAATTAGRLATHVEALEKLFSSA